MCRWLVGTRAAQAGIRRIHAVDREEESIRLLLAKQCRPSLTTMRGEMKQRAMALAIRRIVWAELALTTAIAAPAFAQSQPAATAAASGTAAAAAPAAASGTAATATSKNVK